MLTSDRAPERRITHTIGDFIKYHGRDSDNVNGTTLARLDYLFVHEMFEEYRLFAVVTHTTHSNPPRRDSILGLPVIRVSVGGFAGIPDKRFGSVIVGLPAIAASRPYVVPVIEKADGSMDLDIEVLYSKGYNELGHGKALIRCDEWEAVLL